MPESNCRVVHGWVEGIEKNPAVAGEYRLLLKQEEGRLLVFAMGQPGNKFRLADEVSVAVDRARPGHVLAIVDHSTAEGIQFLSRGGSRWLTATDLLVIAAVAGSFAVALEWMAVPALAAFVVAYWLFRRRIQDAHRQWDAARVAYLIDKDYFRWRAGLDRKQGVR